MLGNDPAIVASADATGRTNRDKIIKANPFLEHFTVADLMNWAAGKMSEPGEIMPSAGRFYHCVCRVTLEASGLLAS